MPNKRKQKRKNGCLPLLLAAGGIAVCLACWQALGFFLPGAENAEQTVGSAIKSAWDSVSSEAALFAENAGTALRTLLPKSAAENVQPDAESCYEQMAQSIYDGKSSVFLKRADKQMFEDAYALVVQDPMLFGISGCQYRCSGSGVEVNWNWGTSEFPQQMQEAQAAAQQVVASIDSNASDYDKVLYVHDWLCTNVAYQASADASDQNLYGALVKRQAVCGGYCSAFQYLLSLLGVQATTISGVDEIGTSHAWNSVVLDGQRYYCDVTWDDQENEAGSYISYNWFCLTSAEMRLQHTPSYDADMPDSSAETYNYYIYRGWYLSQWNEDQLVDILRQQAGNATITVRCKDEHTYQQMLAVLLDKKQAFALLEQAGISPPSLRYSQEAKLYTITFLID